MRKEFPSRSSSVLQRESVFLAGVDETGDPRTVEEPPGNWLLSRDRPVPPSISYPRIDEPVNDVDNHGDYHNYEGVDNDNSLNHRIVS